MTLLDGHYAGVHYTSARHASRAALGAYLDTYHPDPTRALDHLRSHTFEGACASGLLTAWMYGALGTPPDLETLPRLTETFRLAWGDVQLDVVRQIARQREGHRLILIACGKTKRDLEEGRTAWPAAQLYTGCLFKARARYAIATEPQWWAIASALHGLAWPAQQFAPYDKTMTGMTKAERKAWGEAMIKALRARVHCRVVELHMGRPYAEAIMEAAADARGLPWVFVWPCEGLGVGEQLAWCKTMAERAEALA